MTLMTIDRLRPLPGPVSPAWRWKRYGFDVAAHEVQQATGYSDIIPHAALKSSGFPTPTAALTLPWEVPL